MINADLSIIHTKKNFSYKMFVNRRGLPVQGVDGNANLAQCVIEQHELAIAVLLQCELFRAGENFFFTFKILKTRTSLL